MINKAELPLVTEGINEKRVDSFFVAHE